MARNVIQRFITAIFDRDSHKKVEREMEASLSAAGKKAGTGFLKELRAAFDKKMADLKVSLAKGIIDQKEFKKQADAASRAFNSVLVKNMEEARRQGNLTDKEYLKLARTMKRVGDEGGGVADRIRSGFLRAGAAVAGFFALSRIQAFLTDSVRMSLEAEKSTSRLDVALGQLGLTYREVAGEVESYLERQQQTTRFGDEDGREALVNLITITGDYRKSLSLLSLTADVASKRQTTMAEAAETVGKASLGLSKGMQDLGIKAGESGDLVEKLRNRVGGFAVKEGKDAGGQLEILRNLLGEVKESLGGAILGTEGLSDSATTLRDALIDLNRWVKENEHSIGQFISGTVKGLSLLGKGLGVFRTLSGRGVSGGPASQFIRDETERIKAQAKELEDAQRRAQAVFTKLHGGPTGTGKPTLTKDEQDAIEEAERERKRLIKARRQELDAELERLHVETTVRALQIEQGLTEQLAREWVRRAELKKKFPERAAELEQGFQKLDQANLLLAAGFDKAVTPALQRTEQQLMKLAAAPGVAPMAQQAAKAFSTPWLDALVEIKLEIEKDRGLFSELGEAWAFGGVRGLAELAGFKVKENIAQAIEQVAKGIGLSFWNPGAASIAFSSAAKHGAAAAAWGVLAKGAGGGGQGAGGATGAGGGGIAPDTQRAQSVEATGPQVHIYFKGPKPFTPEMEKFVVGNLLNGRERFGDNAKINFHREG